MLKRKKNKAEQIDLVLSENKQESSKGQEQKISAFLAAAKAFESEKLLMQRKLTKIAFILAAVFAIAAVIATVTSSAVLKMKKVDAFVIRVDNSSGFTDIVRVTSDNEESYGETLDKYWLAQFIINRESYNWESIQNMADTVELMSTPSLFSEYSKYINDKQNSPMFLLKDTRILVTKVKSVSFIKTAGANLAQVRFVRFVKNIDGTTANEFAPTSWIGTITYDFKKKIYTEGERRINPLGFQVTSYRVNAEKVIQQ